MCPKLTEIFSWIGLTVHVCCFMLARASTKTFVSRTDIRQPSPKTAEIFVSRKIRQQGHSLAEVSLYSDKCCLCCVPISIDVHDSFFCYQKPRLLNLETVLSKFCASFTLHVTVYVLLCATHEAQIFIFLCPMPPHVLVDFMVLSPGHGSSVTDF